MKSPFKRSYHQAEENITQEYKTVLLLPNKKKQKKPKKKKQNSLVAAAGTRFGSSSSSHNFTSPTQTMGDPHTVMTFHEEVRPRGEVK